MKSLNYTNMCLKTNSTRKSTAKNPIRCLKVVAVSNTPDGPVYHSFYSFNGSIEYKIGGTADMNDGRGIKDELRTLPYYGYEKGQLNESDDFKRRVEAGIHTFSPEGDAARSVYEWGKQELEYYSGTIKDSDDVERDDVAILECEIPVGAEYYKGVATCFQDSYQVDERGYVSDKLHIIRALSEEEINALPYVDVPY